MSKFYSKNYKVSPLTIPKGESVAMKKHVSITYHHTLEIKNLIQKEYWGDGNKRLYYYIDYTFRARYYDKSIYIYQFNKNIAPKVNKIGIFCLNLYKSNDHYGESPLYLIFEPNFDPEKYQPYSINPDYTRIDTYCLTANEITTKYGINKRDIPSFYEYDYAPFNHKMPCNFDWNSIFKKVLNRKHGGNTKDILYKSFNDNGISLDPSRMRQTLANPFRLALYRAIKKYKSDNDYIIPALYFDKKGYKIVYQLLMEVEYPANHSVYTKFVVVIERNKNRYNFVRLINLEMASKNARLIYFVPKLFQPSCDKFVNDNDSLSNDSLSDQSDVSPYNTPASSVSNTNVSHTASVSNSSVSDVESVKNYSTKVEIYPKFIRGETTRVIDLVNGYHVIESVHESSLDITNIYDNNVASQAFNIKTYTLAECDPEIRQVLIKTNQVRVKSLHEICQMNNNDEIETISKVISSINGNIKTSMRSFLKTKTKEGKINKYEMMIGQKMNQNIINDLYLPKNKLIN